MASCEKINLKESLTHLPYHTCKDIPSVHGIFNKGFHYLGDNLHSKKTLKTLHSLYVKSDLDIVNMNSFNVNNDPYFNFSEPRL